MNFSYEICLWLKFIKDALLFVKSVFTYYFMFCVGDFIPDVSKSSQSHDKHLNSTLKFHHLSNTSNYLQNALNRRIHRVIIWKFYFLSVTRFNDTWCFIAHKDEIICLAKSHQEDEIDYPKSHQILSQHSKTDSI